MSNVIYMCMYLVNMNRQIYDLHEAYEVDDSDEDDMDEVEEVGQAKHLKVYEDENDEIDEFDFEVEGGSVEPDNDPPQKVFYL